VIFVTVGGQLPFDRLVRTVDAWAEKHGRDDVFAQVGEAAYVPTRLGWQRFLSAEEFDQRMKTCDAIVSHAGMGTILSALELAKPVLIMPRRAALHEQRNDHQLATAERMRERGLVHVAMDEDELARRLETIDRLSAPGRVDERPRRELLEAIRAFVSDSFGPPGSAARSRSPRDPSEARSS